MPTGYGYLFEPKGLIYSGGGGGVDLVIVDLSVPTGMAAGREAEIEVTFSNKGNGAAGPFSLYANAFSANNYQYSLEAEPFSVKGLAAGETKTETLTISVPSDAPSGPWDIKVAIDNSNFSGSGDVAETDENNNEKWKRKISAPDGGAKRSGPDLVVSEVSMDPGQKLKPSGNLTFMMELKNIGTAPAKGFYVGFYLSTDPSITTDDTYIGYGIVDLEPGESKSGPVPCPIPASIQPDLYYIGVVVDPLQKVAESDETNNAMATDKPFSIPDGLFDTSSGGLSCEWSSYTPDQRAFAAQPGGVFPVKDQPFREGTYYILAGPAGKNGHDLPPDSWSSYGPYDLRGGHKYKVLIQPGTDKPVLQVEEDSADLLLYDKPDECHASVYARNNCIGDMWYALCVQRIGPPLKYCKDCEWESFTPDQRAFAEQPGRVFPLRARVSEGTYSIFVGPSGKNGLCLPPATVSEFGPYDFKGEHKYKVIIGSGPVLTVTEDSADLLLYDKPPKGYATIYARNNVVGDMWYAVCLEPSGASGSTDSL